MAGSPGAYTFCPLPVPSATIGSSTPGAIVSVGAGAAAPAANLKLTGLTQNLSQL
jgi:hypothetical protein